MSLIVIAGGGTGGHIYPGLAIAKVLKDRGHDVHWVGAYGGLEEKIVPREGLPLHLIQIGKLHRSVGWLAQLKTILGFPRAFFQAFLLVRKLKPVAVLGVGGFASGPFLFVSALLRRRTVIWEPNAQAGMTNRLLARWVDVCLLVFNEAKKDLRARASKQVGLPVRDSIRPAVREQMMGRHFRVLIFGGSQGARAINRTVAAWVASDSFPKDVELVHQTGRFDFAEIKGGYDQMKAGRGTQVICTEYLHDMDARYAWADLVICRAGASTAAELAASGKAAIFIPLPTAADDHQLKNAQVFERAGAAIVIEQKNLTVETLSAAVRRFQNEPDLVEQLERAVRQFATPRSAEIIASHVLGDL
jgi:UDP-N-acetylglucosamine--N-acetylmuramyl-(pentapeptide) pyrophosphoryl-undecaprenol N-acetylglucosamine transferase